MQVSRLVGQVGSRQQDARGLFLCWQVAGELFSSNPGVVNMPSAALMKLPKIDPATVKKAKEFVKAWGPAIAGTVKELLDKVFGNKRLKDEIQRLEGELNEAIGHIKALIAENESLTAVNETLQAQYRVAKIMLFVAAGIIVFLAAMLVMIRVL